MFKLFVISARNVRLAFVLWAVCLLALSGCDSRQELPTQSETNPDSAAFPTNYPMHCPEHTYIPSPYEYVPVQIEPEVTYMPPLTYPLTAKEAGLEGKVIIRTLICENGDAIETYVERTSGVTALDEAALDQAWAVKFRPAFQNGHPVKIWVFYAVDFKLE